ncbi:MAG: 23S rRNA (uracil(1939)-C(5))-methyltransferase RlmD [Lachnospiraceae bacterium]
MKSRIPEDQRQDNKRAFHKDDLVTIQITDIGNDGEGIGHADGYTLFVKDAVVGDTVRAKIMKAGKNLGYARLMEVLTPSPHRVTPACPIAGPCGGCQLQALDYAEQLRCKQNKVKNLLQRIGGIPEEELARVMHPIVGMEEPFRYRNKAQVPIGTRRDGELAAGFYAGRTHTIIPMGDCLIGRKGNDEILNRILSWMRENRIPAYDEATGKGIVRHVLIRDGLYSKELMVCLVVNSDQVPNEQGLVDTLREIPGMTSISLSVNRERTNVVMGKKLRLLWGQDHIRDTLHVYPVSYEENETGAARQRALFGTTPLREVTFGISPLSFYQVNPRQTEKLYSIALHFAGLSGQENVWDLYCGVGTISLFLAGSAAKVFGVEVIPAAIGDARNNARVNGIQNAEFQVGKVEEVLPAYVEKTGDIPDVVVVDPPRKGCDPLCLDTILKVRPKRMVYVSCDPATLARDLKILREGGYALQAVQPVDQFANSIHVETVALLIRNN